jgi:uncharacterized oligopeptide transporter (OPT) family protein
LRYHLWLIVSTPQAALLLATCRGVPGGRIAVALILAALVAVASAIARAHGVPLPL